MRRAQATSSRGTGSWAGRARLGLHLVWLLSASAILLGAEPRVLTIGMDTRSRPWAFVPGLDYSKEDFAEPPKITAAQLELLQGLDIDFMKALGQRLNAGVQVVPCAWPQIQEGLLSKQFDLIINAWLPNSRTPPGIVASSPYYEMGLLLAVRADNKTIHSYRDVAGKRLGYFRDPLTERTVLNLGAGRLVLFDDEDLLFEALAGGKLDVAVEDSTYVRWRVAHESPFRVVGERLNRLFYHVGLRKEDRALYQKVETAIQELIQSGEIDRMRKRWESGTSPGR
jgi:ABC-type amino acid transport substrate-binding protein